MNIEQLQKRKYQLEQEIYEATIKALVKFRIDTNMSPDSIDVCIDKLYKIGQRIMNWLLQKYIII